MNKPKVIAVVGPTAAGKTSLSITVAKEFNGEVISADSRQVYRGMDIGSGKVTQEEMGNVPHHLLDVAEPMDNFTAADFETAAKTAIQDIHNRNKLPIIAGGTFFYIELLRGNQQSAPVTPNEEFRQTLESFSNEELFKQIISKDPRRAADIDKGNRHRLVRALEIIEELGHVPETTKSESEYDWLLLGVDIDKRQLHENIDIRLKQRMIEGMIEEVERLHSEGVTWERLEGFGLEYRFISEYLQNKISEEKMLEEIKFKSRQYAKRQMTWLKRYSEINWVNPKNSATVNKLVSDFLTE